MTGTDRYNATIVRRRDLHEGLFFVWIRPDAGEYPPFEPGQYASIGYVDEGGLSTRTYSIGSSARRRESVELFVVHVDDGEFTSWLKRQSEGARLWLSPEATGGFTLEGFEEGKDLVLVSTGTGVAPYFSMYRTYRHNPPWRRIVLINGVRYANDLGYRSELEQVAAEDPRFAYVPLCTREPEAGGWNGLRGRVGDVVGGGNFESLAGFPLDASSCHVYLCGNPSMVDDMETLLVGRGFSEYVPGRGGNLHMEKYWTDASSASTPGATD